MFIYLVVAMILIIILVILKSPQYKGKCGEDIVKNIKNQNNMEMIL